VKQLFSDFMSYKIILFFSIGLFTCNVGVSQSPRILILEMIDSAAQIETLTAEITKEERIEGKMTKQITAVKLIRKPFHLYLHQEFPKKGMEVLCIPESGKALINTNSFPWFNLSLDPYGSLMRKDQHHTIFDSGFDLMISIIHRELAKIGNDTAKHLFYKGTVTYEGRSAHHLELINPDYRYLTYKVLLGEDLLSIAKKLNISEYAILELNKDVDFYDDVSPGQEIQVPSSYAKNMVLYVDKELMLPLLIKVNDSDGLYERYAYKKFKLNPEFNEGEFTIEFKDYGF